ncbi:molybdopterin-dependent oxidoreductase [Enterovibrio sp. ZSDZ35]|uniref:Molybdopterin-dependent oxidoreductase n=1 Tax=Enterovibrio qingdaonensis TaxID=2899818 RepID=A0ABT5QPA8_9GAMM|nr:molybdopterin-dependent oxidoreductase [Enterovibrio sp. ZSDZ35]MDD1782704.1 molybdopterin-dependent oxidoreductase [Enterovibrio sp. ZSDZ35]
MQSQKKSELETTLSQNNTSTWKKTTCAYCGVGCGVEARMTPQGKLEVRGDEAHPANFGRLCSKGLALGDTVTTNGRLLEPSINGDAVSWDQALTHVATSFNDIIEQHGPDSVAFYVSGQLLTEDYYVANKLMKGFIGSANIDTNSRLCMASTVVGHKRAFGEDCVPGNYEDLELADLVVLTGSNLAWCHPVLYQRLKTVKEKRGTKVVVIDPRETNSCDIADLHLPLFPGSDIALFNGLLAYLSKLNQVNRDYIDLQTEGFDEALQQAKRFSTITAVALATGLKTSDIETFYDWFRITPRTVTVFSQGVNQSTSGSDKVNSILNCHLATGRIGKAGSTPFSVTGQPNAMGGREVGGLANTLAAHMEFGNAEHASLIQTFWDSPTLAQQPGLKAIDMFDAIESGQIKAVWIMATNPAVSLPESERINLILANCPMVVVSDCIAETDTTKHANVLLPAQGWSEKSGTVTNSERRISRQRRIMPSPGQAKPDWWIISEVAKRMGFYSAFNYQTEHDIFIEYAKQTELANTEEHTRRQLNLSGFAGMSAQAYNDLMPTQWPVSREKDAERLYEDGQFSTPNRKARFVAVDLQPTASTVSERYGLMLNTGRIRDQWHTMTRTGLSAALNLHDPEPMLDMHPFDASDRGIKDKQLVKVFSECASQIFRVNVTSKSAVGQCFAPIHWNRTNGSGGLVDALIPANTDPYSGQPEFKATPIEVKSLAIQATLDVALTSALRSDFINDIEPQYWTKRKVDGGYLYRLEFAEKREDVYERFNRLLHEKKRTSIVSCKSHSILGVITLSESSNMAYVISDTQAEHIETDVSVLLSSDFALPDVHAFLNGTLKAPSPTICTCKQVKQADIETAFFEKGACSVEKICEMTQAGKGCGNCISEVGRCVNQLLNDTSLKIDCASR